MAETVSQELVQKTNQILSVIADFQETGNPNARQQILEYIKNPQYQTFLNNIFRENVSANKFSVLTQNPLNNLNILKQSLYAFIAFHQTEIVEETGKLPPKEILENYLEQLDKENPQQQADIRSVVRRTIDTAEQNNIENWFKVTANPYAQTKKDLQTATDSYFDQIYENLNQKKAQAEAKKPTGTPTTGKEVLQKQEDVITLQTRKKIRQSYTTLISETALNEYTQEFEKQIQQPGISAQQAHQAALQKAQKNTINRLNQIQDPNQAYFMHSEGKKLLSQTITQTLNRQDFQNFNQEQVFEQKKEWDQHQTKTTKKENLKTIVAPPPKRNRIEKEFVRVYQEKVKTIAEKIKPSLSEEETPTQKQIYQSQFADHLQDYATENEEIISQRTGIQINRLEHNLWEQYQQDSLLQTQIENNIHKTTRENLEVIINNARQDFIRKADYDIPSSLLKVDDQVISRAASELSEKIEPQTKEFLEFHFQALESGESLPGLTISQALLSSDPQLVKDYAVSFLSKPGKLTDAQILVLAEKIDVDYLALHAFLKGHNAQTLRDLATSLQRGYQFAGIKLTEQLNPLDPRVTKILEFADQLEKLENITPQDFSGQLFTRNLFKTLQVRAHINNMRYTFVDQANKLNPFRPLVFGKQYVTDKYYEIKFKVQDKVVEEIKKRPVGWLLTPRYKTRVKVAKFLDKHPKLNKTRKKVRKWMPGKIGKTVKNKVSHWARKKVAKKLLEKGLEKAADKLLKEGFKSLLRYAAVEGLGGTIGAAIGSVIPIPVVGQAIGWIIGTLVFEVGYRLIKFIGKHTIGFIKKHSWDKLPEDVKKAIKILLPFLPIALFFMNFILPALTIIVPIVTAAATIIKFGGKIWNGITGMFKGAKNAAAKAANQVVNTGVSSAEIVTPMVGAGVGLSSLAMLVMTIYASTYVPYFGVGGPGPSTQKYLKVNKQSSPKTVNSGGETITYTIDISASVDDVQNVVIKDTFDEQSLNINTNSISPQPTNINGNTLFWEDFDFSKTGNSLTITYTATTKPGTTSNTKIRNTVTATAEYEGESITRSDSVIINGNCNDIVEIAENIRDSLEKNHPECSVSGPDWSDYYNYSTTRGECVWCNSLVCISYREAGHPDADDICATGRNPGPWSQNWEDRGKLIKNNGNVDISEVSEGDMILFDVRRATGLCRFCHVGLVCEVHPDEVVSCEANIGTKNRQHYPFVNGRFDTHSGLEINSIVHLCD